MDATTKLKNIGAGLNRPLNLLLIDDDDICILIHRKIAETSGVFRKIRSACNGKHALEILKKTKGTIDVPNIILLDLNMPVMGGLAFLEAFQHLNFQNKDRISIATLTSSINKIDKQHTASFGVSHFLTKPLTQEALNPVIDSFYKTDLALPEISHATTR